MATSLNPLSEGHPNVVGSFGDINDLRDAQGSFVEGACDLVEIRLDLITVSLGDAARTPWQHLKESPLLFTARRIEEGGALALSPSERMNLLESVLNEAALIDIEVASIDEMAPLVEILRARGIPWIASFHDFEKLPDNRMLGDAAKRALDAGAHAFKSAALLHDPADLARLAEFQLADHGLPVATMGMGPLAPVSRLLCAQFGSVLNYGFIGKTPTAPGQWDAGALKQSIERLVPFRNQAV
jgi:3-dehydroquinate dehydratase-1